MKKQRVVVGMSGGVDSSVTAWLLKEQGYDVVGLFMKNWEDDDDSEYCSTRQDWIDVVSVADLIGIDVEAVNFAAEYKDRVFAEFLREYAAGRTKPNLTCCAMQKSNSRPSSITPWNWQAQTIATGHYARVQQATDGRFQLLKAADLSKDQSYFLHRLNQQQLSRTIFPLGDMPKTEVRAIAERIGLPNAKKKDSTGICFIGERPFRDFLNRYLPTQPGPMKTPDGRVVGEHIGLAFYTLGQRKGIGLGGKAFATVAANRGLPRPRTSLPTRCMSCKGMTIRGCSAMCWIAKTPVGWPVSRQRMDCNAPPRRVIGKSDAPCRFTMAQDVRLRPLRTRVRISAVGRDAGAIGRALRWRCVPGRRHHYWHRSVAWRSYNGGGLKNRHALLSRLEFPMFSRRFLAVWSSLVLLAIVAALDARHQLSWPWVLAAAVASNT